MPDNINTPILSAEIPRFGNPFSQWLGQSFLRLNGWQYEGQFSPHRKMVIAVAPHTSNWDFVVGLAVVFHLRLKISFFGKHSIFIPPFDRLLRRWGGIPIQRTSSHGVVGQMIETVKSAEQLVLAIAPEGTRSRVYPWKSGFMNIAHQAAIPVFLIGLDFKRKKIVLGPTLSDIQNVEQEMQNVYRFYAKVTAKFPEKVCLRSESIGEE